MPNLTCCWSNGFDCQYNHNAKHQYHRRWIGDCISKDTEKELDTQLPHPSLPPVGAALCGSELGSIWACLEQRRAHAQAQSSDGKLPSWVKEGQLAEIILDCFPRIKSVCNAPKHIPADRLYQKPYLGLVKRRGHGCRHWCTSSHALYWEHYMRREHTHYEEHWCLWKKNTTKTLICVGMKLESMHTGQRAANIGLAVVKSIT